MRHIRSRLDKDAGMALLETLISDPKAPLLAHTLAIAILAIGQSVPLFTDPYVSLLAGSILLWSLVRLATTRIIMRQIPAPKAFWIYGHHVTVLFQAVGWALLMIWSMRQNGFSSESLMLLLICSTVASGATSSLSANPVLFNAFVLILVGVPLAFLFYQTRTPELHSLRLFMALYLAFTILLGRKQNRILKKSIEYRLRARRETEKFRAILESIPGFVSFINTELEYVFVSESMRTAFPEIAADGAPSLVGEIEQQTQLKGKVQNFMNSADRALTCEIQGGERLGGRWYLLSMLKVSTPTEGAVLVSIDIDELKRSQIELVRQKEKTMNSARLVSLGEMAGGVAHEINNPLTVVVGKSEQIQMLCSSGKPVDPAKISDYASAIERTAHRIAKIIKGLRAFSRDATQDPFERVAIKTVLEDTLSLCANRMTKAGVQLKIDFNGIENATFVGRPIQVSQALLSLLTNAYDAVEKTPQRVIEVLARVVDTNIEIRVRDSGPGIPLENRDKIMQPFFTTKAAAHATGLGLSIAKGLIESHGGSLALDETEALTTFVVSLPRELMDLVENPPAKVA